MKNEKDTIQLNLPNKKRKEPSPKKQLNNSFTKEFINSISGETGCVEDEKNLILAKSHFGLGDFIKMQEQILGECNEVSSTVLDEKIKRNICSKGFDVRKIKTFVNHNDIDVNDIEKNNIEENTNFLKIREIPEVSEEDFEKMKYNLLDDKYLEELQNFIIDFKYPLNSSNSTIAVGALFPLERLIEYAFNNDFEMVNEMNSKYNLYEEYIFNYRTIKGDGNCYYRAAMFRYFEIIILNKEISLLRKIIIDMKNSFNSEEIMSRKEIKMNTVFKAELPLKIMIIILNLIQKGDVELAHLVFLKSLLICPIFDYGLIFYFRYIIYIYIKDNEDKLYLQSFPIKIGNLLPSKYETEEGEFLFNSFYQNYLLKMFMDAEKIIVYLTPFILGINLDIIIFDDESEIIKKINYEGNPKYSFAEKIFLMNRKNHYELIYTKKDNKKYEDIFEKYINNDFLKISLIVLQSSRRNNIGLNQNKVSRANKNGIKTYINNTHNDTSEDNNNKSSELSNSKVTKKKNKTKKKLKKQTSGGKDLHRIIIKRPEIIKIKKGKNTIPLETTNISNLQSIEIRYENSINNSNSYRNNNNKNKINLVENEKEDEIDDEEATKETSLTFSDKNRNLNDENKNIIQKIEVNYIKKKTYKKAGRNTIKKNTSFKKGNFLCNDSIKKVNHTYTIADKNSNNIALNNLSNTLDNNNTINKDIEKIKLKTKKIKIIELDNNNFELNNSYNSHNKQKEKFASTGKRFVTKNNLIKNPDIKRNTEILNININNSNNNINKSQIKSLTLENVTQKKKILVAKYECVKCGKYFQIKQKTEKPNLCKECTKKEIIEKFTEKYLSYIYNCLSNQYEDKNIINNFDELLKSEINIDKKNMTIENSICQINKYNIEKKRSFHFIFQKIFKEMQKNICLFCCHKMEIGNNSEKSIRIPCGCYFCSFSHFEAFFKDRKPIIKDKEFVCYCSHKYSTKELYDLGIMFLNASNKALKKCVIDNLNNILKNGCCICENKNILLNRIRYKDKEDFENNEENRKLLSTYKELKHFFCKNCTEKINPNELFLCKICDKFHFLYQKNK